MNNISEYKLLGYYLITIYETNRFDNIKYDDVKKISTNVMSKLNNEYYFSPIDSKADIVKKMISKGVFKTSKIDDKLTFKQIYNYELIKYINANYSSNGELSFKLPQDVSNSNKALLNTLKNIYLKDKAIDLNLQKTINNELRSYCIKQLQKIKTR